jgi:hypothetical protein
MVGAPRRGEDVIPSAARAGGMGADMDHEQTIRGWKDLDAPGRSNPAGRIELDSAHGGMIATPRTDWNWLSDDCCLSGVTCGVTCS